jgi:hypothetical protein
VYKFFTAPYCPPPPPPPKINVVLLPTCLSVDSNVISSLRQEMYVQHKHNPKLEKLR